MSRTEALAFAVAVATLVSVGWFVGLWIGTATRRNRFLDLYDVFDDEDQDAIG